MNPFNLKNADKDKPYRIKDRHIRWEEKYGDKSKYLKKRFDKEIGPGAYYRWEGHDYYTDSDYFVVVGPAVTKYGKKRFFAGIKKLPPDWERHHVYAPYGEYFSSISSALSRVKDKWGVPYPKDQTNYTVQDLQDIKIPRKLKA